jgi:hypothetical protein
LNLYKFQDTSNFPRNISFVKWNLHASAMLVLIVYVFCRATGNSVGGYIQELPFIILPPEDRSDVHGDNLLQLRLNTNWYPWKPVTIEASGRVLFYGGSDFREAGLIASQLTVDPEFLDLTWAQGKNKTPLVAFENIDRLSLKLTKGAFEGTIGRQRINWCTNLIWNPNDWFNAFNFLDFAYYERPGADALRVQYYPDATTVAELVLQAGRTQDRRTFAGFYKFNGWGYDWQFQGGLSGNDLAAGFSWSGSIKGAGFRGEASLYRRVIGKTTTHGPHGVASLSADYTFKNSLYLQGSMLYNGFGTSGNSAPLTMTSMVNAKNLIPKQYALYGEVAYQLTPLLRPDLAASICPTDGSFFMAPSVSFSVLDNLDLQALAQIFIGKAGELYGKAPDFITISLKWSY